MNWESLNLNEKSELMKLYLKNGITSLSAMKDHYNSFATGGPIKDKNSHKSKKSDKFPSYLNLLKGYLFNPEGTYMTDRYTEEQLQEFRRRAYANYMPYYTGFKGIYDFKKAIDNPNTNPNTRNIYAGNGEHDVNFLDDLYATYLGIPVNNRRFSSTAGTYLSPTNDRPLSGATYNTVYKLNTEAFPELEKDIIDLYYLAEKNDWRKSNKHIAPGDDIFEARGGYPIDWSPLGDFIVSKGFDPKKGEYISLYDDWDLNPIKGKSSEISWLHDNKHGDLTQGFGHPYSIYNKIYLDDYYGINTNGGKWLPELNVWDYEEGSSRFD